MKITFIVLTSIILLSCTSTKYYRQLSQLPEKERDRYKVLRYSIEAIGNKTEIEEFNTIASNDSASLNVFVTDFWKKRDPNPLTPENEMKNEYEKRINYVLENFRSNQYFKPWDDRGDTYLKLGEPSEIIRFSSSAYEVEDLDVKRKKRGTGVTTEDVIKEKWVYYDISTSFGKPLELVFQPDILRGYIAVPDSTPLGELEELARAQISWISKVEQQSMQYFYEYGKEQLRYAFGLTPFLVRDSKDLYNIYLTINAPAEKLITPTLDSIHYIWRILIQDENYNRLFEDSSAFSIYTGPAAPNSLVIIDQKELNLTAGTYIITSELVNSDRSKGGLLQSRLILPPYVFPNDIELSKAILAREIRMGDSTDHKFLRNGLVIKPWVAFVFGREERIWLYFEVYNIPLDREGKSRFEVRYYLQDLENGKKYLIKEKSYREDLRDYTLVQSFSDSLFKEAKAPIKTNRDYVLVTEIKDKVLGKSIRSLSGMFKFE